MKDFNRLDRAAEKDSPGSLQGSGSTGLFLPHMGSFGLSRAGGDHGQVRTDVEAQNTRQTSTDTLSSVWAARGLEGLGKSALHCCTGRIRQLLPEDILSTHNKGRINLLFINDNVKKLWCQETWKTQESNWKTTANDERTVRDTQNSFKKPNCLPV